MLAPLALYLFQHPAQFSERSSQVSVMQDPNPPLEILKNSYRTATMFFANGDLNWRHNYAGKPALFWCLAFFFLIGTGQGIAEYRRGNRKIFGILFLWLLVAALPAILTRGQHPHFLRTIMMIPAVCMISAVGAVRVWKWGEKEFGRRGGIALALGVLLWIGIDSAALYFHYWGKSPETIQAFDASWSEVARSLNALPRDLPKYVVVGPQESWEGEEMSHNAYPIMFLTNTFLADSQQQKHIFYLPPSDSALIPPGASVWHIPPR